MKTQLYPKLADGTIDRTDIIELGHGQRHGTIQTWDDTGAPFGYQGGDWHFILKAKIKFVDYWKAYKEGHPGIMQRAVLEDISKGHYKGHGVIFANLWNGGKTSPIGNIDMPCALLESWGLPDVPKKFGFIRKDSNSPLIKDDVSYDMMVVSTTFCDSIYSRYYLGEMDYITSQYVILKDTGDVEDNNWVMDRNRQSLALFDASGLNNRNPEYPNARMVIERLTAYWRPATTIV